MPLPRPLTTAPLSRVRVVFTDVDGTLTTGSRLTASTLRALERLTSAGLQVVLVTGRPAGWAECWARTLPVKAVIAENGGVAFVWRDGVLRRDYPRSAAQRLRDRERLEREVARAMRRVPGARLSSDSRYTEVDLAIDYNEDAHLGSGAADRLERLLRARGVFAVRSNVHVNCWVGRFDKRTAVARLLRREWKTSVRAGERRFVYVGDSFNDAPMFRAFPLSVGVANVLELLTDMQFAPRYVTRSRGGRGFEELARALLEARR